ncbi:MAG: hypothetical protein ACTSRH_00090 [Promethearchaeota archaeon]
MLHNLLIINADTGINLASIKLSETGFEESDGVLISGVVKAIDSFLREVKFGEIRYFITHQKKVIIYIQDSILLALICDKEENENLYIPKLELIGKKFSSLINWDNWNGEINIFESQLEFVKKILSLTVDEVIEHLNNCLTELSEKHPEIYGYRINLKLVKKVEKLDNIEDFELSNFISSNFFEDVIINQQELSKIFLNSLNSDNFDLHLIDYGRFSIYVIPYIYDILVIIFLQGNILPLEIESLYYDQMKKLSGF